MFVNRRASCTIGRSAMKSEHFGALRPKGDAKMTSMDVRRSPLCSRREFVRVGGGLAVTAGVVPGLARRAAGGPTDPAVPSGARSCILVYLLGGPPHLDMFDLKPEAPAEIRGPFQPIATTLPGVQICEHLPLLAGRAGRYALVRSVSHPNSNHTPMIYYTLTGYHTALPAVDNDTRPPQPTDYPHLGAVLAQFRPAPADLPGFVSIPELATRSSTDGEFKRARMPLRGGAAGFLGRRYDPLAVNGPPGTRESIPALALPDDVSLARFERRGEILALLDRRAPRVPRMDQFGVLRDSAVALTGAVHAGGDPAFSLESEPAALRDRYGRHRFGQSMLLARRLAEAGVPMVAVHFNEMTVCDGWDTHSQNFEGLRRELLPMLDQSLSALMDDLDQRGLADDVLIACWGEFGRTPKINGNAGRDHWGDCSTAFLAGGGIRGGQVLGASDRHGAFPRSRPVDPIDLQATVYHRMGLDAHQLMHDHLNRPLPISHGRVIRELV
jgi:hypothetical protein